MLSILLAAFSVLSLLLVYWIGRTDGVRHGREQERVRLRARLARRTRHDWRGSSMALDVIPQHERN